MRDWRAEHDTLAPLPCPIFKALVLARVGRRQHCRQLLLRMWIFSRQEAKQIERWISPVSSRVLVRTEWTYINGLTLAIDTSSTWKDQQLQHGRINIFNMEGSRVGVGSTKPLGGISIFLLLMIKPAQLYASGMWPKSYDWHVSYPLLIATQKCVQMTSLV